MRRQICICITTAVRRHVGSVLQYGVSPRGFRRTLPLLTFLEVSAVKTQGTYAEVVSRSRSGCSNQLFDGLPLKNSEEIAD